MGTGSKVASVIFRLTELCSAIIVVALLGRFFYLMRLAPSYSTNGRLIYTQVISCLELIASLILVIPFKFTFYAWPLDIIFFICSIVAFGLLASLNSTCSSFWYWNYWGYYWGRFWAVRPGVPITPTVVASTGCGSWRAILAWLFIGAMAWMASALVGSYVFLDIGEEREENRSRRSSIKEKLTHKHRPVINPETGEAPTPKP